MLEVWVCFDLVYCGDHLGLGDEVLELVDCEVADAYGTDLSGV